MHGACAAQSGATTKFCAGEFQRVAQDPEQRSFRRDANFSFTAVDAECKVGHVGTSVDLGLPTWYSRVGKTGSGTRTSGFGPQTLDLTLVILENRRISLIEMNRRNGRGPRSDA